MVAVSVISGFTNRDRTVNAVSNDTNIVYCDVSYGGNGSC